MANSNNSDLLTVDLPETLDQFITADFHFIHISCDISKDVSPLDISKDVSSKDVSSKDTPNNSKKITILYKTIDYNYNLVIDQPDDMPANLQDIKPGREWSILVE